MAIQIVDKKNCTGCFACHNACPAQCILMKEDEAGFWYPAVDETKCIACNKCEKVCPVSGTQTVRNRPMVVYAAWSKNHELRYESTSGGVFSELAEAIIHKGGCVAGAVYDENNIIQHAIVDTLSDLRRVRQSKYAQSNINDVYQVVKQQLRERKVLFCGAPCQVAGLKNYLAKDSENLITIDFICRGVNSPKAFREWLREIEASHHSAVQRVWFKYKEDGWHRSPKCTKVFFKDGTEAVFKGKENTFMYGYLGPNLYIRPSCGACRFKGEERCSDITVGDFWGIEERLDDNQGTSLVIINTERGKRLFEEISMSINSEKRKTEEIIDGNVCFKGSVNIHPKSEQFLRELGTEPFSDLVARYSRKTILQKAKMLPSLMIRKWKKGFAKK